MIFDNKSGFAFSAVRLCAFAVLAGAVSSCSIVSPMKDYDAPISKGEGVLLVSVQTDLPIQALHLADAHTGSDDVAMSDIPAGYTVRAVRVKAGDYEWLRVDYPDQLTMQGIQNHWVMLNRHVHLRFSVKPGTVNYPGDLVIQQSLGNGMAVAVPEPNQLGAYEVPELSYRFGQIDRTAQAQAAADDRTRAMIGRLGLVYTGPAK